jgi:hypothetical protein
MIQDRPVHNETMRNHKVVKVNEDVELLTYFRFRHSIHTIGPLHAPTALLQQRENLIFIGYKAGDGLVQDL